MPDPTPPDQPRPAQPGPAQPGPAQPGPAQPRLVATRVPDRPEAAVLVLHGGAQRAGRPEVSPTQLSVVRMVPVAHRIARGGRLAVYRLLNSLRGWDGSHTPVDDVAWAMRRLRDLHGDLPTSLVGHSLGGRAALLGGGEEGVRSIVALNPWVYRTDDPDLTGRRVLVVHGTEDRVADPSRSAAVARNVARTAEVGYVSVPGARHAMLRHGSVFERAAAGFTRATLLGTAHPGPASDPVARVLAGEQWVTAG